MRLKPRVVCCFLALALALLSTPALSQQQRGRGSRPASSQSKNAERARLAQEAATLLVETADKARTFDDLFYRARIQALAAHALWPQDERRARVIFRRAWEAAEESDKAEREESEQQWGTISGIKPDFSEARREVLKLVATRDARLAGTFLSEMAGQGDSNGQAQNEQARSVARRESSARRLALANEMLQDGEARRAAQIAAPLVETTAFGNDGVSPDLIAFLLRLRERSATDSDALYLRLLRSAATDPHTDAHDVLLLSAQVISPSLVITIDDFGALQFRALPRQAGAGAPTAVAEHLQTTFFNLAATVLLRPVAPRADLTMRELLSQFYTTGRLLPFFENSSAPYAAHAPALRALHSQLFNAIEANRREQVSAQFGIDSLTPAGYVDPLRLQSDQLAHATDAFERERIALSIVRTAVRNRFWDRARRAAAEIEDASHRKSALSFIQVHQIKDILRAYSDDKEDDFEGVARFVRGSDVPPFAKAWGLVQAVVIAARKKNGQTQQTIAELLNEAEDFASHVGQGTPERVAAYGVVAAHAAQFDQARAWRLLHELVKAANAVEDFTGDEVSIELAADENSASSEAERFSVEADVFRLDTIFATMAPLDFNKALAEARALDGEVPRALAIIAIAKSRIQNSGLRTQN